VIRKKGELIKNHVDAVNVTDNQTSVVRMCSLSACAVLERMGLNPVLQMVTRDRNRIAIQSDILGAAALGINNILCLSGDHQKFGDNPKAKNVYDLDSINLVAAVRTMREGKFLGGEDIKVAPKFFIGAASNPFADPFEFRVVRLAKKVAAGAQFIQTQCIYNVDKFRRFMQMVVDRGLHEKVFILGGVTPMKSLGMARYMKKSVPGMDVPDEVISRLKGVEKPRQAAEGIRIAIETIQALREMKGVAGVHVMAIEWEERVPEIGRRARSAARMIFQDFTHRSWADNFFSRNFDMVWRAARIFARLRRAAQSAAGTRMDQEPDSQVPPPDSQAACTRPLVSVAL
jgi:methylenetetrahydrofolate reductase (NADPH)